MTERLPRRWAGPCAGVILLAVYALTLAPGVTFWDAGEFVAAAHSLGIPHPPGTPLFVLLLNVWARLFSFLPYAVATNLFSAVVTAAAAALTAALVARASHDQFTGLAAALCAGVMSSVWLNATETEVYAASLALTVVMLWCAERAGRTGGARWRALVVYLIVLSVPLHLSALVGAPAAIYLASTSADNRIEWDSALALVGILVCAVGVGQMSPVLLTVGAVVVVVSPGATWVLLRVKRLMRRSAATESPARVGQLSWRAPLAFLTLGVLAASVLMFLLVRAQHDPAINQGNPSDLETLAYVVARRQYAVAPMWPRNAPFWLQVGNLLEYADWQTALATASGVMTNAWRVIATATFVVLAVFGSVAHRRIDRRSWRAIALLTLCGSLGVVVYLNLRMGPSFGYGFVPDNAVREARERDYFFVLGFWGWGVWAGYGAVALARKFEWRPVVGVAFAALPVVLNWGAVNRRREPEALLPQVVATALLTAAPRDAVLFVEGDNDTYPLWAMQQANSLRRDVTVVTMPLLMAGWYRQEVARRTGLLQRGELRDRSRAAARIAHNAMQQGRPVAAAITLSPRVRSRLGADWTAHGLVYVAGAPVPGVPGEGARSGSRVDNRPNKRTKVMPAVDSASTQKWAHWLDSTLANQRLHTQIDPIPNYFMLKLSCPRLMLTPDPAQAQVDSLDSICNR